MRREERARVRQSEGATARDEGVGEACLEAGHSIRFGDAQSTHTPGEGARFYQRACDLGIANGCARLGYHYGTGWPFRATITTRTS